MTIAPFHIGPQIETIESSPLLKHVCRQTIQGMVDGFACQDIDKVMLLVAEDAIYCDVLGGPPDGDIYRGKKDIRSAFQRQFDMCGPHTFVNAKILVEGQLAFASWTMVVGDLEDSKALRLDGIDEFTLDEQGLVLVKKAWLKGHAKLRNYLILHRPQAVLSQLGYALRSSIQ